MTTPAPSLPVRASQVLRRKQIWIAPILLAAAFTTVVATTSARSSTQAGICTASR
jgi:hypothetical protein